MTTSQNYPGGPGIVASDRGLFFTGDLAEGKAFLEGDWTVHEFRGAEGWAVYIVEPFDSGDYPVAEVHAHGEAPLAFGLNYAWRLALGEYLSSIDFPSVDDGEEWVSRLWPADGSRTNPS